jgi:hypothetical protein
MAKKKGIYSESDMIFIGKMRREGKSREEAEGTLFNKTILPKKINKLFR